MILEVWRKDTVSAAHWFDEGGPEGRLHGHNYDVWAAVSGPVQAETGLVMPRASLKAALAAGLDEFDGRCLNDRLAGQAPTTGHLAHALWAQMARAVPAPAALCALDVREDGISGVRLRGEQAWQVRTATFAAAHRTYAPRLTEAENEALYGICANPAGHGHNYRVEVFGEALREIPAEVMAQFDHRNLSVDVPAMRGRNVVTEAIAALWASLVPGAQRVRVWELPDFYAEFDLPAQAYVIGRRYVFHAAHWLGHAGQPPGALRDLYGRCGRGETHGHTYALEVRVRGRWDERTETAIDLGALDSRARAVLAEVAHANLDDWAALEGRPSTGENVAGALWARLLAALGDDLLAVGLSDRPRRLYRVTRGDDGS